MFMVRLVSDKKLDDSNHVYSSWGVTVQVGSVQGGQSLDVLKCVQVPRGYRGPLLSATLKCRQNSCASDQELFEVAKDFDYDPDDLNREGEIKEEIYAQKFRNSVICAISDIMALNRNGTVEGNTDLMLGVM
jgi:hypothetical protein